jgi:hypothetical protein
MVVYIRMSTTLFRPTYCRKIKKKIQSFRCASNFVKIGQQDRKAGMDTHTHNKEHGDLVFCH